MIPQYFKFLISKTIKYDKQAKNPFIEIKNDNNNSFENLHTQTYIWIEKINN